MSMESPDAYTTLNYSCLCGQVGGDFQVRNKFLPLLFYACHCLVCRHFSGELVNLSIQIPGLCLPVNVRGEQKSYQVWEMVRWFCSNCGTPTHTGADLSGHTNVYSGVFTQSLDAMKVIGPLDKHIFVLDTKDGGFREFLLDVPSWVEGWVESPEIPFGRGISIPAETRLAQKAQRCTKLYCQCHCGGVKFWITQPNAQSSELTSPWPDLLKPYHRGSSDNPEDVKWWLRDNNTRYLAGLCACNSCRLGSGSDVQSWTFVPKANIEMVDGTPLDFESMESLQRYEISTGNYREFCNVCAATCFWHCDERPKLIDVSVGLMHAASGVLAEEWLDWETGRISFKEKALKKTLIHALEDGLKSWGLTRSMSRCSVKDVVPKGSCL